MKTYSYKQHLFVFLNSETKILQCISAIQQSILSFISPFIKRSMNVAYAGTRCMQVRDGVKNEHRVK
jgi:hypothetical protein